MHRKILYIGGFELPDKNAAAQRVVGITKILKKIDCQVIFSGVTHNRDAADDNVFFDCESKPLPYPVTNKEWLKTLSNIKPYTELIEKYTIDTIIAYNVHYLVLRKLTKYCKKHCIQLFCDLTEWQENRFSLKPLKFIKWLDTCLTMNYGNYKVDGLIVISSFLQKKYKNMKTVLIPPLVDVSDTKWDSGDFSRNKKYVVTYTGSTGRAKDRLDIVLDSISKINSNILALNIIGLTKDDFLKRFKIKSDALLPPNAVFYGRLNHSDCIQIVSHSNCSIIIRNSSRKNNAGFPTKFVEAFTLNKDIIISDISDVSKYSMGFDNVIVLENNDSVLIKNHLLSLINRNRFETTLNNLFDYNNYIDALKLFLK